MKSFIILFVSLTMLVRPLWPIAEYIMNYDYIVNVLCENRDKPQLQCDGKCYLAKQLAKESKQSDENPFGNSQKIEVPQFFFENVSFRFDWMNVHCYLVKESTVYYQNLHPLLLVFDIIQPPEQV